MADLSAAELRERRANVDSALGSLALEGLHPDQDALSVYEDFAAGRIDGDGLEHEIGRMVARYKRAATHAA